jgi:mannose/cellobiose epimerase-like protein (N-acyl-D-glucosamine 2-epimerase family)
MGRTWANRFSHISSDETLESFGPELKLWAIEAAFPLWAKAGRDDATGGFFERLNLDGSPDRDAILRTRVQARQIYVYAHASVLGWYPGGAEVALDAYDYLVEHATESGERGFCHLLTPRGEPLDRVRDCYDHAFFLLAFAWCWKATGATRVLDRLKKTLDDIDAMFLLPDGSFREDNRNTVPRRQNPHMHLFEAMLALHETGAVPDALDRADRLLKVVFRHCLDTETGLLGEFFDADFQLMADERGQIVEPGHMCEWVWLLGQRLRAGPMDENAQKLRELCHRLLRRASLSDVASSGLMIDEADRFGRPRRTSRRLWPQTELVKACITQAENGDRLEQMRAGRALVEIARQYLAPAPDGGWMDQFSDDGRSLLNAMPASSFYHLFIAIAESNRFLDSKRLSAISVAPSMIGAYVAKPHAVINGSSYPA